MLSRTKLKQTEQWQALNRIWQALPKERQVLVRGEFKLISDFIGEALDFSREETAPAVSQPIAEAENAPARPLALIQPVAGAEEDPARPLVPIQPVAGSEDDPARPLIPTAQPRQARKIDPSAHVGYQNDLSLAARDFLRLLKEQDEPNVYEEILSIIQRGSFETAKEVELFYFLRNRRTHPYLEVNRPLVMEILNLCWNRCGGGA